MASLELIRLHKLHELDGEMLEIKKHAAAMVEGRELLAQAEAAKKVYDVEHGAFKVVADEVKELENQNQAIDAKAKKDSDLLYGGKVVNPREVDALEKDIQSLKLRKSQNEDRMLELMDRLPPLEAASKAAESIFREKKKALDAWKVRAAEEKTQLETRYRALGAKRPELVKVINPSLLARYEAIRAKYQTGMSEVLKTNTCNECGTRVPEKTLDTLKNDGIGTCESCHRLLYWTDGVV